jgi:hypothetical protein
LQNFRNSVYCSLIYELERILPPPPKRRHRKRCADFSPLKRAITPRYPHGRGRDEENFRHSVFDVGNWIFPVSWWGPHQLASVAAPPG